MLLKEPFCCNLPFEAMFLRHCDFQMNVKWASIKIPVHCTSLEKHEGIVLATFNLKFSGLFRLHVL